MENNERYFDIVEFKSFPIEFHLTFRQVAVAEDTSVDSMDAAQKGRTATGSHRVVLVKRIGPLKSS